MLENGRGCDDNDDDNADGNNENDDNVTGNVDNNSIMMIKLTKLLMCKESNWDLIRMKSSVAFHCPRCFFGRERSL